MKPLFWKAFGPLDLQARSAIAGRRLSDHRAQHALLMAQPGASETRDNGSRNPALGVNLRDLAHSRGSARFAPRTPPVCRSMYVYMRQGLFQNNRADAPWTIPFQDLARSAGRHPPYHKTQHNLRRSDPQSASHPAVRRILIVACKTSMACTHVRTRV